MEVKRIINTGRPMKGLLTAAIALLFLSATINAQPWKASYTVKNNKMFVSVGKLMKDASIDSFTLHFNLNELKLKNYLRGVSLDSLKILGWQIELNNSEVFVI